MFGYEKVISRGFSNEWLWSFLKERVYSGGSSPNNHEILKERIIKAVERVTEENLQHAVNNVACRLKACWKMMVDTLNKMLIDFHIIIVTIYFT